MKDKNNFTFGVWNSSVTCLQKQDKSTIK